MHLLEWRGDHHIAEMVLETRVATGTFGADEILPEIRAGHVQVVMTALENLPPVASAWLAVEGLEVALDANRPNLVLDLAETLVQRRDGRVEQTFVTWLERDVDVTFLRALLDAGVSPDVKSPERRAALMFAVLREREVVVEELLRRGAAPDPTDPQFDAPLLASLRSGNRRIEGLLRRAGARASVEEERRHRLVAAVQRGLVKDIDRLLSEGASVDERYRMLDGESLLHVAVRSGQQDVVGLLLQRGASSFAVDDRGDNVLDVAAATGQESLRTFVLEYGRAKRKALRDALAGGGSETERRLARHHRRVDRWRAHPVNLVYAAAAGDENVVRSLLAAGADPNQMQRTTGSYAIHIPEPMLPVGEIGWYVNAVSPLGVAACAGNLRIVELLLSEGARLVPEDAVGPLEMAAMAGQLDMVRFLLSVGADANGARLRGSSLTAASRNGRYEVVRVLIEHGAEVNVKPGGLTPLIWAVMNAHVKVVRVLMQAGADPTEPVLSTTAAELAEQSPNAAIQELVSTPQ